MEKQKVKFSWFCLQDWGDSLQLFRILCTSVFAVGKIVRSKPVICYKIYCFQIKNTDNSILRDESNDYWYENIVAVRAFSGMKTYF